MTTTIPVLFKKQQKDDKKEILQFEHRPKENEADASAAIFKLAGEMVNMEVTDSKAGPLTVEFKDFKKDSNKTTLNFVLKGDSEAKSLKLYEFAGHDVTITIEPSQGDLTEELGEKKKEEHKGIEYELDLTTGNSNVKSKYENTETTVNEPEKADPVTEEEENEPETDGNDTDNKELDDDELPY